MLHALIFVHVDSVYMWNRTLRVHDPYKKLLYTKLLNPELSVLLRDFHLFQATHRVKTIYVPYVFMTHGSNGINDIHQIICQKIYVID